MAVQEKPTYELHAPPSMSEPLHRFADLALPTLKSREGLRDFLNAEAILALAGAAIAIRGTTKFPLYPTVNGTPPSAEYQSFSASVYPRVFDGEKLTPSLLHMYVAGPNEIPTFGIAAPVTESYELDVNRINPLAYDKMFKFKQQKHVLELKKPLPRLVINGIHDLVALPLRERQIIPRMAASIQLGMLLLAESLDEMDEREGLLPYSPDV